MGIFPPTIGRKMYATGSRLNLYVWVWTTEHPKTIYGQCSTASKRSTWHRKVRFMDLNQHLRLFQHILINSVVAGDDLLDMESNDLQDLGTNLRGTLTPRKRLYRYLLRHCQARIETRNGVVLTHSNLAVFSSINDQNFDFTASIILDYPQESGGFVCVSTVCFYSLQSSYGSRQIELLVAFFQTKYPLEPFLPRPVSSKTLSALNRNFKPIFSISVLSMRLNS